MQVWALRRDTRLFDQVIFITVTTNISSMFEKKISLSLCIEGLSYDQSE